MDEGISFDIIANDKTSTGVNSALGNLGKLDKASVGGMVAGGKAQVTALARDMKAARVEAAAYEKQIKQAAWQSLTFGEKYQSVSNRVNDAAKKFGVGLALFTGTAVAMGMAGKKVYEFAKSGAEIEYTTQKFNRLTASVGGVSDVFMNQLRGATKGTVSDMALAKQASDMFQLGLAGTTQEAVRLSKVQTALGMDTGELTLALANQSKRRLDQLGLSLTKFNEIEAKLKASGMSNQAAFKEAFLQTAEQSRGRWNSSHIRQFHHG